MSPRDKRAILRGLGIALAALILLSGIPSGWRAWREARASLGERRLLLERSEASVAGWSDLDSASAEVRARFVALAPRLLPGGTEADAGAALEALANAIGDRARVRVRRVEVQRDSAVAGKLRRVGVRLEIEGDWAGATRLFQNLAEERTSLSVGEISVQATDPTSPGDRPEVLVAQAVVRGWYLPEEGP